MTMLNARYYGLEPWPHHDELTALPDVEMEIADIMGCVRYVRPQPFRNFGGNRFAGTIAGYYYHEDAPQWQWHSRYDWGYIIMGLRLEGRTRQ